MPPWGWARPLSSTTRLWQNLLGSAATTEELYGRRAVAAHRTKPASYPSSFSPSRRQNRCFEPDPSTRPAFEQILPKEIVPDSRFWKQPQQCGFARAISTGNASLASVLLECSEETRAQDGELADGLQNPNAEVRSSEMLSKNAAQSTITRILKLGSWGPEKEESLRSFSKGLTPDAVGSALQSLRDLDVARSFFEWAGKQQGYTHTSFPYNVLLGRLGQAKRFSEMWDLLDEMQGKGCRVTPRTYKLMVISYFTAGLVNEAFDCVDKLRSRIPHSGSPFYTGVIRMLLYKKLFKEAKDFYQKLVKDGYELDTGCCDTFIAGFCNNVRSLEALTFFEEMIKEGYDPHHSVYTFLIHSYSKAGKIDEAVDVIVAMQKRGSVPRVFTYESVIDELCKANRHEEAFQMFIAMKSGDCHHRLVIFNRILTSLFKHDKSSIALEMYSRLTELELKPDNFIHTTVISGLCRTGQVDKAVRIFTEIVNDAGTVCTAICNALLHGLYQADRFKEAEDVFSKSSGGAIVPDNITYSTMIAGQSRAGELDKAQMLLSEMKARGFVPDGYSYCPLIGRMCKEGRVSDALLLFEEMKERGIELNSFTCGILLKYLSIAGMMDEASEIYNYILAKGFTVQDDTLVFFLEGLSNSGRKDEVNMIYKQMLQAGYRPNTVTVDSALHTLYCGRSKSMP